MTPLARYKRLHSALPHSLHSAFRLKKLDQSRGGFRSLASCYDGGAEDRNVLNLFRDGAGERGAGRVEDLAHRLNGDLSVAFGHGGDARVADFSRQVAGDAEARKQFGHQVNPRGAGGKSDGFGAEQHLFERCHRAQIRFGCARTHRQTEWGLSYVDVRPRDDFVVRDEVVESLSGHNYDVSWNTAPKLRADGIGPRSLRGASTSGHGNSRTFFELRNYLLVGRRKAAGDNDVELGEGFSRQGERGRDQKRGAELT